jgi:hypothetical protein
VKAPARWLCGASCVRSGDARSVEDGGGLQKAAEQAVDETRRRDGAAEHTGVTCGSCAANAIVSERLRWRRRTL